MLVHALTAAGPGPALTATVSGGKITISFPTTTGSSYQVEFKNTLSDASWQPLGSAISGNNAVQSVQDTVSGSQKFYQVEVQ